MNAPDISVSRRSGLDERLLAADGAPADPLVLRSRVVRAGAQHCSCPGPQYVGQRVDGARGRRHDDTAVDRAWQGPDSWPRRHPPDVEHLSPSPGPAARRAAQRPEHRVPAAPLDLRSRRPSARCSGVRGHARLRTATHVAQALERTAVLRCTRQRRRSRRLPARAGLRLLGLRVRSHDDRRVPVQLEGVPRDLPRAVSRRGHAPRPAEVRRQRQLRVGLRRSLELPDPRHQGRTIATSTRMSAINRSTSSASPAPSPPSLPRCGRAPAPEPSPASFSAVAPRR